MTLKRLRVLPALMLLGVLTLTPAAGAGTVDTAPPVLTAFSRTSADTLSPTDELSMSYTASDPASGIASVTFYFQDVNNTGREATATGASADAGPATVTIGADWYPLGYTLIAVGLVDLSGNTAYYVNDGGIYDASLTLVGEHTLGTSFEAATFDVDNPAIDISAPELASFSVVDPTLSRGDSLVANYSASDTGSGLDYVAFMFEGPGGQSLVASINGGAAASGPAFGTIPNTIGGGTFTLSQVVLADADGNGSWYYANGTVAHSGSSTGPTSHALDLSTADLTIDAPVVLSVGIGGGGGTITSDPAGITCPGTCTAEFVAGSSVSLTYTDDGFGTFLGWGVSDPPTPCLDQSSTTCELTADYPLSITAMVDDPMAGQPDLLLGKARLGPFIGDGAYVGVVNAGTQKVIAKVQRGTTVSFFMPIQNDGHYETALQVSAPGNKTGFAVRYFVGTADVTSQMAAFTKSLGAGKSFVLRAEVTVKRSAPVGVTKKWLVNALSTDWQGSDAGVFAIRVA